MTSDKPRIALLMPPHRRDLVFPPRVRERLEALGEVVAPEGDTAALAAALPDVLPTVDACITSWRAPLLREEVLDQAPRLKIIAHAAGSIRRIIPIGALERGIVVCHSADVIAEAVSEYVVFTILTGLRRLHELDAALKAKQEWDDAIALYLGHRLAGKTLGLIGCGYVARRVIALLRPFDLRVLVYDPYLAADRAAQLGVVPTSLDELLGQADIVSNHAPVTPETRRMLGARELAQLKDGVVLINSGRSWSMDQDALLAELRAGRIWAALDVFDEEPLPVDSPFRELRNVFITPHRAGHTLETLAEQGMVAVQEVGRFFAGEPLKHRVLLEQYPIMN